jgi:hypothetical protein
MEWLNKLRGDPVPWLLEPQNPSVRHGTLIHLLDRPHDDPEALEAQEAIPTYPPVAELLAAQKRNGYWVKRDYYLPKHYGTFWVLCVLGDLGLSLESKPVRKACEFMFTFQRDNGAFCRRRRVAGEGIVWDEQPGPCTHARIVSFLIQFGYGDDPRIRAGVDWLLATQRDDGLWDCGSPARPGCLRATHDVLRVAALDPKSAAEPAIAQAVIAVCNLLMEPGMGKYHVGIPWTTLEYPYFDYSLISTLDALARLGCTMEQPKIATAIEYLLSRQLADGAWPLDKSPYKPPFEVGRVGEPNKWLTLDALRVIKLFHGRDGRLRSDEA